MEYIGVVAGNYIEYMYYIQTIIDKEQIKPIRKNSDQFIIGNIGYFYVNSVRKLQGRRKYSLIYYGTYNFRKDLYEIIDANEIIQRCNKG